MRGNLTEEYPADFLAVWPGCAHLDCLPKCRLASGDCHCERLAVDYAAYHDAMERSANGKNTGGKSYISLVKNG